MSQIERRPDPADWSVNNASPRPVTPSPDPLTADPTLPEEYGDVTPCDHKDDDEGSAIMLAGGDRYECAVCGERFRLVSAALPSAPDHRLREAIEALPEMVGDPNDGGYSLVRRSDVRAVLSEATPSSDPAIDVDVLARASRVKRHASEDRPMVTWVPAADFDLIVEMLRSASQPPEPSE